MKTLSLLAAMCLLAIVGTSFKPANEIASIHWLAKKYTDNTSGETIEKSNTFICTREGLTWSYFDQYLLVKETKWNVTDELTGTIEYVVAGDNLSGTIRFDFTRKIAEVQLKSAAGPIHFELVQDQYATLSQQ